MRKMNKGALLAALSGTMLFGFGGCLGGTGGWWKYIAQGAGLTVGGDLVDAFVMDGLLLGTNVSNATALGLACAAIVDVPTRNACLAGL